MLGITQAAGGSVINPDRMWHYTEGIQQLGPDLDRSTASASSPGPSSLWLDATGRRLPVPLFPGFDTLGTLAHIMRHRPRAHAGSCSTQKIIEKEFALSGSEQNPDITGKSIRELLETRARRRRAGAGRGVQAPRRGLRRRARPARARATG